MKMVRRFWFFLAAVLLLGAAHSAMAQQDSVQVPIKDTDGKTVANATLATSQSGVRIQLEGSGLPPGQHGLHIHGKGACQPPAFKSAGAHYSPNNKEHGFLNTKGPHAGDLPTLAVNSDGAVQQYDFTTTRVSLSSDSLKDSDGSSLVVHAMADDYHTDPGGGTGERIACGIIALGGQQSSADLRTGASPEIVGWAN